MQSFGDRIKGALSPKNLLLTAGGALAGAQVFSFLTDSINAASDLNETISKTGVVIGQDSLPELERWAETAADTFGQSKRQALDAASQFAVFGKSAGLAGDDLAGFSTDLTQLASDMASFSNTSPEEAITAIGAALRGESEPIRRYGVLIDDASLRQKALELGIISTTKNALTPQQRVLAAQALIMEQTADAQGDFARTSDGLANTQRTLSARFEDVQASIGEKLLPIALEFANFVSDVLLPALSFLTDNVLGPLSDGIGNVADSFREAAGDVHFFAMNFGEQGDRVHGLADDFGQDFDDLKDRIRDRMLETGESFTEAADHIEAEMKRARDEASSASWEMMQGILSAAAEGNKQLKVEAHRMAAVVPDEIRARWEDARRAAFQMAVEHAKGILDGQNQVKVAFEVLTQLQEEEQTKAQRISYLQGLLSSQELKDGLNDGRDGVRGAASALRAQIVAELASLGVDAYNSGWAVGSEVARGIYASAHLADGATSYLAAKISGYLPRSEPKEGPLRGITRVGDAIVHSITDGIYSNLGHAASATSALANALAPAFGVPALATGTAAAEAAAWGGGGPTYILQVEGSPKEVSSFGEMWDGFRQLSSFDDRSLVK